MIEVQDKVEYREGTITLPTYMIMGENRNPVFRSQYGVAYIYPYTLLDEIAPRPCDKTYHTLEIENRYLRVTVIPDLGGRVYSVYDKISQREVFYKNSIVKFSPLAIRGAFFSGGMEFSFPVAHAPTTADAVNWDMRQNPDGSASISTGGLEHISGLHWMITLTLFPERCALAQDVFLYNPTSIPGRYHYWTNASLDANDQTEFIYPLRRVRSYEYAGTASWPFARLDLIQKDPGLPGMEGVPMWPANRMQQPINFRWQKNMLAQVSIFGRNVSWDFFGAWQHSIDYGYAHFARAHDVGGMKLWSWGNAGVGVVNQTALTDDGSLYAETQCGAMETQLDFDFLQPGKTRAWREWWLPLRGMGGLSCASAELGARVNLAVGEDDQTAKITIAVCPACEFKNASLQLATPGKILYHQTGDLSPNQPYLDTIEVPSRDIGGEALTLSVIDALGNQLMNYTLDRDPTPVDPYSPLVQTQPENAEDYYQLGLRHENFDNRPQAKQAYQQALMLSPEHGQTAYRYGLMLLRSADYVNAERYLRCAAENGVPEAHFYLGVMFSTINVLNQAEASFKRVEKGVAVYGQALIGLGSLAMRAKDWSKAIDYFKQAVEHSEPPLSAQLLLACAYRRAGYEKESRTELGTLLVISPLNHLALREMAALSGIDDRDVRARLERMMSDDRSYALDLACAYLRAGLLEDALAVLTDARQTWDYAMLDYLSGYIAGLLGDERRAAGLYQQGMSAQPDFVFPSRLEEIEALKSALKVSPGDHKTKYFLGNFYYAHERYEEGKRLWEEALEGLKTYDVLLRNLGLAYWQCDQDPAKAITFFEEALAVNPRNYDLYLLLDDLYKAQNLVEKRQDLLSKIKALVEPREDVRKRKVAMMVDLGYYKEALALMTGEQFVPLEMDQSFHDLYVRAWMLQADDHLQAGEVHQAINDYLNALEYPANIGVGKPTTLSQAEIYYRLGCAYEQQGMFRKALAAWQTSAREHHPHGDRLYEYVQFSLDKLSRYSELGFE